MALKDEIKAGRKELMENGTIKDKLAYFFDYYTLHTIVVVVAVVAITSFIYQQVTKPDTILSALVLNVMSFDSDKDYVSEMNDGFMDYIGLDQKEYEFSTNSSLMYNMGGASTEGQYSDYEASQAIMVQIAAGAIDIVSSPLSAILDFGYGDMFVDLRTVLSDKDLTLYEPYFLYVDGVVIEQREAAFDSSDINANDIPCPDPTKPEEMEDPIPVFINVTECKDMANIYNYSTDILAVAIAGNAPNPERISDFLAYLFQK